ncbi:uncharacterized protein PAC_16661 [Phialocephala subalpina]|uniref:BTB domain-containing protein n=1 Tax=Phialocephala subalpina TaxID=576137 RepID=A0A1L7XNY0_9HELO|nr:uncharacterized protein PAC_16661 [Phialocephala subalpina]
MASNTTNGAVATWGVTPNTMPPLITPPTTAPPSATPPSTTVPVAAPPSAPAAVTDLTMKPLIANLTKPSEPPSSKVLYLFDQIGVDTVSFRVGQGDKARSFLVHKKILCAKVLFFEKLFNGPFAEGISQTAEFPEDDPTTFGLLIGWIYSSVVENPHELGASPNERYYGCKQLMALFALAEKYNIVRLQDQTMDRITRYLRDKTHWLHAPAMGIAYSWTHEKSKLRLFLARHFVYIFLTANVQVETAFTNDNMRLELTKDDDFFKDVFAMLREHTGWARMNKPADPLLAPPCDYHQHSDTEPCPYKQK